MYRVGIDIGGTFTDMLVVGEDGAAIIGKTLTTPGDPSLAVEDALRPGDAAQLRLHREHARP